MLILWNKKRRKNESFQDMSGMRDKRRRLQSSGSLPQNLFIFILHHKGWVRTQSKRAKGQLWRTDKMNCSLRNGISGHGGSFKILRTWSTCSLKWQQWELKAWSSLSHERIINLEIKDVQWAKKAEEGAELESILVITLWWLLCATKLITGFKSFLVVFQLVKHAQLLSLFICFAVWDVWVVLWHYLKLLSRDRQKHLDRDSKLFLELKRRFQARSQLSCPG